MPATAPDATEREQQSADAILTAVRRSERLVDGLLALTRSESTMLDAGPVDLADLTGDVVGEYVGEADQARVRLDLALDAAEVRGDPALLAADGRQPGPERDPLQRAGRHRGGFGSAGGRDGTARRSRTPVPAVSQEEIDQLFQPFVRGDWARRNRAGFGLGLAIVRSVATAHSGTVQAIPGPNGGLRVTVSVPGPRRQ